MLRAYYSMPPSEFMAQLRTYVIAMGLGPQVVDAVDNLIGADEFEELKQQKLDEIEMENRTGMKEDILDAVKAWFDNQDMPLLKDELITIIDEVEV